MYNCSNIIFSGILRRFDLLLKIQISLKFKSNLVRCMLISSVVHLKCTLHARLSGFKVMLLCC